MTFEEFSAIFLTKKKLGKKLRARLATTMLALEEVRNLGETMPDPDREKALQEIDDLEKRISDQATKGVTKPGDAWVALDGLGKELAEKKTAILGANKKAEKADPTKRFERVLPPVIATISEARAGTLRIVEEKEAKRLLDAATDLTTEVRKVVTVNPKTVEMCATLEECRLKAGNLLREVRKAQGLDPQPDTQKAVSRAVINGASDKIKAIGDRLNSPKKDAQGRTAMADLQGRLKVFDEKFAAQDTDQDPEAAKRNNAMRMAAIASVTAERISDDINDPYLKPRIGKALVAEYAPEMKDALAEGDDDDDDAKDSILLAQALVMDDPVTKLMGGKLDPTDAVQRIRDMATVAGEPPSVMFKLLRQQFEMKMGSLTSDEVYKGNKSQDMKDADTTQPFKLADITGEIEHTQFEKMFEFDKRLNERGLQGSEAPKWDEESTGLAFKPTDWQMHQVVAKDTFGTLAEKYKGDATKWEDIKKNNQVVVNPKTGEKVNLQTLKKDDPLPVGLQLAVPGNMSLLDQLAPYVEAWDEDEDESEDELGEAKPKWNKKGAKDKSKVYTKLEAKQKGKPSKITEDVLKDAFAKLRSPKDQDPNYIQVTGLGQSHAPREPLKGKIEEQSGKAGTKPDKKAKKGEKDKSADKTESKTTPEEELHGQLNPRQYAHLRMLARADDEDRQAILAKTGKPVEDVVAQKISERYGKDRVDDSMARKVAKAAEAWIGKVPLTITFTADRLFSDPNTEGPAHGAKYKSEVEFSRGKKEMKELIGRDGKKLKEEVGTQGGIDTGYKKDRGDNYMRWRRDKDSREGRLDDLAYEDQQIFGAANPAFEAAQGSEQGTDAGGFGKNYYGNAHFLLNDSVRNRCAFIVRAEASKIGGKVAVQRKNAGMLLYDMLSSASDAHFLDAMLSMTTGKGKVTVPGLKWEVHLYGGFDMTKDAKEIYLPNDIDDQLRLRIEKFAATHGIDCKKIAQKPADGIEIVEKQEPKQLVLPPL